MTAKETLEKMTENGLLKYFSCDNNHGKLAIRTRTKTPYKTQITTIEVSETFDDDKDYYLLHLKKIIKEVNEFVDENTENLVSELVRIRTIKTKLNNYL